jgi:hypothetical protein
MGRFALPLFLTLAAPVLPAWAQDLAAFEKKVTVTTLDNGLTLIVCERPEAPVFSFFTRPCHERTRTRPSSPS